jgi:hypothetical protein
MASESDVVEIYVRRSTRELVVYIPAAGMTEDGDDLPDDAVMATSINIDDVLNPMSPSVRILRSIRY